MNQLKLFIELTRLKKPIGYMLLFWPCIWGLTLVYDFSKNKPADTFIIKLSAKQKHRFPNNQKINLQEFNKKIKIFNR